MVSAGLKKTAIRPEKRLKRRPPRADLTHFEHLVSTGLRWRQICQATIKESKVDTLC
jgi:hypothetical protein